MKYNKLINETSPYLLQHACNPVDWLAWGDEAFHKAQAEDKLILVSIGYSACHWCHVMEHESFEDIEVADLMNKYFVCIKVDREERPDVDQIYMEAVQRISGRGGWPSNCFALPNGEPVWGGTYFPKHQWMEVLTNLNSLHTNEPDKIREQAKHLTQGIREQDFPDLSLVPQKADEQKIINQLKSRFDNQYGGMGTAPKFPMPVALDLILQLGYLRNNNEFLDFIYLTLDRMASGGIYDQAGGGFARYSVDERWFAPHFEKMLYDNAQLISLYSNAYKTSGKKEYERIVSETFGFIKRELTSPDGAFYSALDADSEGIEGKFYTWTYDELKTLLNEDEHFFNYFNITSNGNWEEGVNILHSEINRDEYAHLSNLSPERFESELQGSLRILLDTRAKRIRPGLDDKILTSWNALMITALCDSYQAFKKDEYLETAKTAMNYLQKTVKQADGGLKRTSKNGQSKIDGFLDDYAFYTKALISLYQVTFDEVYIKEALAITSYVMNYFYDESSGIFYYTSSKGEQLIARKTEIQDNVIPSSVGTMVLNLTQLSQLMNQPDYENIAEMLIAKMHEQAETHPSYYAQWALLSVLQTERQEIAICGDNAENYRASLQRKLRPGSVYAGSTNLDSQIDLLRNRYNKEETLIYRCKNKACELPVNHLKDF